MASVSKIKFSDPATSPAVHDQRTRLVPARQVYITSEWATGPVLQYLLSGDPEKRENALFEIDDEISSTKEGDVFFLDYPRPYKHHDIEDTYERIIEPRTPSTSSGESQPFPTQVHIWTKKPNYLKTSFKPNLFSLISKRDEQGVMVHLFYTPLWVFCPQDAGFEAVKMAVEEIDEQNSVYVATALKISRLYATPITWTKVLLDPNVPDEEREYIDIDPIEVNAALDTETLKALGGLFALSQRETVVEDYILPTPRAAIQKPATTTLSEEYEIIDLIVSP